jgi:23S rRNA (pseudouridine1915-N3)-methyltransferase
MIKIKIVCVGKIKENYLANGIGEYLKRLSNYAKIELIEVKDEKIVSNNSDEHVKEIEGKRIIEKLDKNYYNIFLDVHGKEISSEQFADFTKNLIDSGKGNLCFVIAGSLGFSQCALNYANFRLSFSKLTFTHQMIRLLLLEQIYRVFKINNNEVYHK